MDGHLKQVAVRAEAKRIGQRAIKRANAERTVEDAATAQRAALMAALSSEPTTMTFNHLEDGHFLHLRTSMVHCSPCPSLMRHIFAGKEPDMQATMDALVQQQRDATEGEGPLAQASADAQLDPLEGIDLAPLHRCVTLESRPFAPGAILHRVA